MAPIALLSVSDKTGLIPLAKALTKIYGYHLLSSGGTAELLEKEGISVERVSNYTGAQEILGGRVKTLHPRIHGGILAKRKDSSHLLELSEQNINLIDLVVVNLYPFKKVINNSKVTLGTAIENIDIGGPTMIRAAAKNYSDVSILTRPEQYQSFLEYLKEGEGNISEERRFQLALEAFEHTADYDIAISNWLIQQSSSSNKSSWLQSLPIKQKLRYGENPHQEATWYSNLNKGWGGAKQIQGKELSTNNLLDLEAAISTVREFNYLDNEVTNLPTFKSAAVVIKHTNPCGVAISSSIESALTKALDADRTSAFGGIVALNQTVSKNAAEELKTLFLECIVAPSFEKEALEILSSKTNLRLLELSFANIQESERLHIRSILGGLLVQEKDDIPNETKEWEVVTTKKPSEKEKEDLSFAWSLVRHVRSNAIVLANDGQSIGIGAGQMNRIGAAKIALEAAGEKSKGSVMASDGFFPFDDTIRLAAHHGISAIIQPGGSIRDKDSIMACNELNISMIFTGKRHFLH